MPPVCRSVIDIGTNSVKLLVAEVAGRDVRPILEESHQTRLGQGFYKTHRLQPHNIALTATAVTAFAEQARQQKAATIRIIATSAARDATNSQELTSAIEHSTGLKVEILSGDQEAELVFRGVSTDAKIKGPPLLLLDVGGGSTEFIFGEGGHSQFRESFPLGTVRLLEQMPPDDPPTRQQLGSCRKWLKQFLEAQVAPKLRPVLNRRAPIRLIGTGGTASILACIEHKLDHFDRGIIEGTRLSRKHLRRIETHLWSLALEERKKLVGLPRNRADVVLMGTAIYEAILREFGFSKLCISTRGLRFGAIL